MKLLIALFTAALGVAALALVADSPLLVLVAILLIVIVGIGTFALSVRTAQRGGYVLPYLATLAAAVGLCAIGVGAIVLGADGDAPGLVLLGIVIIVNVIVGAFAVGLRTAERGRN